MKNFENLIYLDRDFISAIYEIEKGYSPETKITKTEGMNAGVRIPLFSAGASSVESKTFAVAGPAHDTAPQRAAHPVASLSTEAKLLLKEAAQDAAGIVQFAHYGTGDELVTNDKNLLLDNNRTDPRTTAAWEAALKELVAADLLTARGTAWAIFDVTKKGYDAADRLPD